MPYPKPNSINNSLNGIYQYCVDPSVDEPIMLINKHIGYDDVDGQGVDGGVFQQELMQLDTLGKKRINVYINSPGGIVTDGYNIYSAILDSKTPVDTYCTGMCASIAGVIFQAGRKRVMADYGWLMYHNPFGGDNNKIIETMSSSIITMISSRCGISEDEVEKMMDRTTYILADEAKELKLCDEIKGSDEINTKYLKKIRNTSHFHRECNKILNSLINNNQNQLEMIKVTMKLGLNDSAPEGDIVKAIEAIENRAKKAEADKAEAEDKLKNKSKNDDDEMDKLKAKIAKMEEDKKKNDEELEDCKAKLKAFADDKAKAEEKAEDEKAEDKIRAYAKIGRIKNEEATILEWKQTSKKIGLDVACKLIETLPLNKEAVSIEKVTNKVDFPTTAATLAAELRNKRNSK